MASSQATEFNNTWAVLQQFSNAFNGFSAVLLQRKDLAGNVTGEKVLAIAGTDPSSPADLVTDFLNVAVAGTVVNMGQYTALESFYAQLISTAKLTATEQITVTGHSLGGFLAQAFTARHSAVVASTYTYNAPGFGSTEALLGFLGLTDAAGAAIKITNVHATDGLSVTAGLGTMLGASQPVRIEAGTNPLANHSVLRLVDALAVGETYGRLQPNMSTAQANALFAASGNGNQRQENALDVLRGVFIGPSSTDTNKTAIGNSDAFYSNLYALQNSDAFKSLAGKVTLSLATNAALASQAPSDFAALVSLTTLSPITYSANGLEGKAALDAVWQASAWSATYQAWQADAVARANGQVATNFTDAYLNDRQALLQRLIVANTANSLSNPDGYLAVQGTQSGNVNTRYVDITSSTLLQVNQAVFSPTTAPNRYVIFGDGNANAINGSGQDDRAYGGAGDDTLNGLGGADYLEGNTGDDKLNGGDNDKANDVLLGGKDTDTYTFTGAFGSDTIIDSDGLGSIVIGTGSPLNGGKKQANRDNVWESDDKAILYTQRGTDLIIEARSTGAGSATGYITIKDWSPSKSLGITLAGADTPTQPAPPSTTFIGDQRAKLIGTETQLNVAEGQAGYNTYAWSEVSWATDDKISDLGIAVAGGTYGTASQLSQVARPQGRAAVWLGAPGAGAGAQQLRF